MGNFYNMGWGGAGFGFGWIIMILFWGLVIWAIIMLAKNLSDGGCCSAKNDRKEQTGSNAMNILKERYAKGEISKEEFERMKIDLQ